MSLDIWAKMATLAMPLVAITLAAHRPEHAWKRWLYWGFVLFLSVVSVLLQAKQTERTERDKHATEIQQAQTQAKLDQSQKFLQVAEDRSRDCNAKIDAVDARLLVLGKASPTVRKQLENIHRQFERNVSTSLSVSPN